MKNFPVPYPNELVYSTIARAGIYQGIISPKQLLDEVYDNRKVVATLGLPSHLHVIAQHLNKTGSFSVNHLIYKHTIFPLYAPFVGAERRDKAVELMVAKAQGAVHLMLGVVASKVKSINQFRYCPTCAEEQLKSHGECFWMRTWYLPALPYCPQHGALVFFNKRVDDQRHQYFALSTFENTKADSKQGRSTLASLAPFLAPLLNASEAQTISPSYEQWTFFYKKLAEDLSLSRGNVIKHELIAELVKLRFSAASLQALNLSIYKDQETCWLKGLFRKHRKAFGYLQHSIVWRTLLPKLNAIEILRQASVAHAPSVVTLKQNYIKKETISSREKQNEWHKLVQDQQGVKAARQSSLGGALYAWLYRYDRDWLLNFNQKHKVVNIRSIKQVDWEQRDRQAVYDLLNQVRALDGHLEHPRITTNWLLKQIHNGALLAKNLEKLPFMSQCLTQYVESTADYQIRRLRRSYSVLVNEGIEPKRWILLRRSGLSAERMTEEAKVFLQKMNLVS